MRDLITAIRSLSKIFIQVLANLSVKWNRSLWTGNPRLTAEHRYHMMQKLSLLIMPRKILHFHIPKEQ